KSWTRDSQEVFVRNPAYWNAPRPYIDQVIVKVVADDQQRINTFLSGGGNVVYVNVATESDQVTKGGGVPNQTTQNGGMLIYFNTRKPPFNDPRARQAVSLAIDRADLIKTMDNGILPTMNSIFGPTSPFYDSGIQQVGYDPAKAQQLFDQIAADTGGPLTFAIDTFTA